MTMIRQPVAPGAGIVRAIDLRDESYVEAHRQRWREHPPLWMTVIEFYGDGDPAFGGSADDRSLGTDGRLIEGPYWGSVAGSRIKTARFETIESAHAAALRIPNLRPGGLLGISPWWFCDEAAQRADPMYAYHFGTENPD